ncbi:MAG: hypothetical protein WCY19_03275 [Candidatus Gastranaerophilaceae bacterium]
MDFLSNLTSGVTNLLGVGQSSSSQQTQGNDSQINEKIKQAVSEQLQSLLSGSGSSANKGINA